MAVHIKLIKHLSVIIRIDLKTAEIKTYGWTDGNDELGLSFRQSHGTKKRSHFSLMNALTYDYDNLIVT